MLVCQGFPRLSSMVQLCLSLLPLPSSLQWAWQTHPVSTTSNISPVMDSIPMAQVKDKSTSQSLLSDVTKQYVDICTCEFIPGYVCKCPVHLLFFPSTSHLILIIQPLMTCLKLTGSTVKEVTEALPSHSPSQRAAAQGKVHTYFYTLTAHNMWPQ